MHLVDDELLVAIADRGNGQSADHHLADIVDAGMAGRVDLEHVDVTPLRDLHTGVAFPARIGSRPRHAVECARQNTRGRGLPAAARACEHERMRETAARDRVAERTRHRLLPDDIVEPLRPPLSRENLIGQVESKKVESGK
jgi:hypothetical protein